MSSTAASMGHQTKLATIAEATYGTTPGAATEPFVFVSESLTKRGVIVERSGLRGTRSRVADDTRLGPYTVGGMLVLEPTPGDLAIWLPRILGGTPSGDTPPVYPLAEKLPSFTLVIDRVAKVFTYAGCKVNRAVLSGSQGGLLRLALDLVAQNETVGNAGTFPELSPDVAPPYIFSDLSLTLASTSRQVRQFSLTIDNALVTDRFMNSVKIVDAPEGDRTINLSTVHAWNPANTDLYAQTLLGAPGTLVLTNALGGSPPAGYQTTFSFATLQTPDRSPTVAGREEVFLNLEMTARKLSGAAEMVVTHDATA